MKDRCSCCGARWGFGDNQWIPVSDKRLKFGEKNRYLFVNGKKEVTYGYAYDWERESVEYVWINDMDRETNEVATLFMELPKPPAE